MRSWNVRHWIGSIIIVFLFIFLVLFFYYTTVQRPLWDMKKQATHVALAQSPLSQVIQTELSHNEQAFVVVYGVDEAEEPLVVWINEADSSVHFEYVADTVSKDELIATWRESYPDGKLLRVVPSLLQDEYAWEVYYELQEAAGKRKYYDYYRFTDGEWLSTYTMTLPY